MPAPWADVDFDAEPDWDRGARPPTTPPRSCRRCGRRGRPVARRGAAFLAAPAPTSRAKWTEWSEAPNLRRMLVDMIEEYARHTGHADLIRESIDGLVGEDSRRK